MDYSHLVPSDLFKILSALPVFTAISLQIGMPSLLYRKQLMSTNNTFPKEENVNKLNENISFNVKSGSSTSLKLVFRAARARNPSS